MGANPRVAMSWENAKEKTVKRNRSMKITILIQLLASVVGDSEFSENWHGNHRGSEARSPQQSSNGISVTYSAKSADIKNSFHSASNSGESPKRRSCT